MTRAILLVLDSVGCGGAPDAAAFGDEGANTLAHIAQACAEGKAEEGRSGPLTLANLNHLGLGAAVRLASGGEMPGFTATPTAAWGAATEVSRGKDTPSGHWELAGLPVPWDWHFFPDAKPAFPPDKIADLISRAGLPGILGDCHASGTEIIERLGEEHLRSGKPICYTSADSVFQIAAHEEAFGLERLYDLCEIAAAIFHPMRVGRVIARPFVGHAGAFERTTNRHDYAIAPPGPTLPSRVESAGAATWGIGKIKDIFAGEGITHARKGLPDAGLLEELLDVLKEARSGDLVFANLVEFDSLYGHRRDVSGYARALEWFDGELPRLLAALQPGDLLCITADHGNDPTWRGTEHTRERVPVLMTAPGQGPRELGLIAMVDVGETLAAHLGLAPGDHGGTRL